jgi:hypothetical protein
MYIHQECPGMSNIRNVLLILTEQKKEQNHGEIIAAAVKGHQLSASA